MGVISTHAELFARFGALGAGDLAAYADLLADDNTAADYPGVRQARAAEASAARCAAAARQVLDEALAGHEEAERAEATARTAVEEIAAAAAAVAEAEEKAARASRRARRARTATAEEIAAARDRQVCAIRASADRARGRAEWAEFALITAHEAYMDRVHALAHAAARSSAEARAALQPA